MAGTASIPTIVTIARIDFARSAIESSHLKDLATPEAFKTDHQARRDFCASRNSRCTLRTDLRIVRPSRPTKKPPSATVWRSSPRKAAHRARSRCVAIGVLRHARAAGLQPHRRPQRAKRPIADVRRRALPRPMNVSIAMKGPHCGRRKIGAVQFTHIDSAALGQCDQVPDQCRDCAPDCIGVGFSAG